MTAPAERLRCKSSGPSVGRLIACCRIKFISSRRLESPFSFSACVRAGVERAAERAVYAPITGTCRTSQLHRYTHYVRHDLGVHSLHSSLNLRFSAYTTACPSSHSFSQLVELYQSAFRGKRGVCPHFIWRPSAGRTNEVAQC